mgnify:CR=1 FL=1
MSVIFILDILSLIKFQALNYICFIMHKSHIISLIACLCFFVFIQKSVAQDSPIYNIDWTKDSYVFATGGLLLGSAYLIDRNHNIITATELNQLNAENVNSFDRSAISNNNINSAELSDYCRDLMLAVPLTLLASKRGRKEWGNIGILYMETLLTNTAATFVSKIAIPRNRPFTYNNELSIAERQTSTAKQSFYSGHTSHVSSLSFFTASVLSDLYPESKLKFLWWSAAATVPAVAGYWRYDAGRHFPTDVITGYVIGAAIGCLVPRLHKIRSDKYNVSLAPTTSSLSLNLSINLR